jgi:hypothetical protein
MASIASYISHGGQSVAAADTRGLFLKVFSGEVLRAFERAIKVAPLITGRTISSGKSAQFPTTGVAAARFFTPGENLFEAGSASGQSLDSHDYLSKIKQSERVIYVDELLTSACFIDDLDEAMSHYDYRSIFARELGAALARHQDNYALYTLIAAGYNVGDVSGEITPGDSPSVIDDTDFLTNSASALDTLYDAARILDENDVPKEDRYVLLNPTGYYNLLKGGIFTVSGSGGSDVRMIFDGGGNDYVGGQMVTVAGMPVIVSTADGLMSKTFVDTTAGDTTKEISGSRNIADEGAVPTGATGGTPVFGDAETLAAVVFHKSAAGMVKLRDITMESEYIIERQGTLMVAKLATGMGALRNDAVQLITDAS